MHATRNEDAMKALMIAVMLFGGSAMARHKQLTNVEGAVQVNVASVEQLMTLPGVGKATAKKIVDGRPYANVEDLKRAVGQKRFDKFKALVRTTGADAWL